jgi:ubiquinone/menaquinone biosynthesis C-methylase UbiE
MLAPSKMLFGSQLMEGRMMQQEAVWDREQAESYARWMGVGARLVYAPFARQVVRLLPSVRVGSTIVDLGTGPAQLSIELCKLAPQAEVIGVDPSAEMLEVARRNASEAGVTNFEARLGAAERLPIDSDAIHVVVSQWSLHEWDDPRKAFSEVFRVLEPRGSMMVKDFNRTWLSPWKRAVFGHFHPVDMFKFGFQDVADLLREAGFDQIKGQEKGLQFFVQGVK